MSNRLYWLQVHVLLLNYNSSYKNVNTSNKGFIYNIDRKFHIHFFVVFLLLSTHGCVPCLRITLSVCLA